jgi:hypothetical protein
MKNHDENTTNPQNSYTTIRLFLKKTNPQFDNKKTPAEAWGFYYVYFMIA